MHDVSVVLAYVWQPSICQKPFHHTVELMQKSKHRESSGTQMKM